MRLIGLLPSMLVAAIMGQRGLNTLLVASWQVILSFVLPVVAFPLIWVTSNPKLMTIQEVVVVGSALESEKAEVEVVERTVTETRYIDHSNGKIMMGLGYLIWLVVLIANAYVLYK